MRTRRCQSFRRSILASQSAVQSIAFWRGVGWENILRLLMSFWLCLIAYTTKKSSVSLQHSSATRGVPWRSSVPLCRSAINHSERVLVVMVSWAERSRIIGGVRFEVGPPMQNLWWAQNPMGTYRILRGRPAQASARAQRNQPEWGLRSPDRPRRPRDALSSHQSDRGTYPSYLSRRIAGDLQSRAGQSGISRCE